MSQYLYSRVHADTNITVMCNTEIVAAQGNEVLESVRVKTTVDGEETFSELKADKLFILIGAKPKTSWLKGIIPLDEHGFIITGEQAEDQECQAQYCKPGYKLRLMETVPGVFTAGDIRKGAINSVSAAVGEGAHAITNVWNYLVTLNQ